MKTRCPWCVGDPLLEHYHDTEWGVPKFGTRELFESLTLEIMQTGLSWRTVLGKREAMRERFFNFDPAALSTNGEKHLQSWLQDRRLIRHAGKLRAMVNNAHVVVRLGDAFPERVWGVIGARPITNHLASADQIPAQTPVSLQLTVLLRELGFRFIGPVTAQSFMQAAGLLNDHLPDCFRHTELSC